MSRGSRKAGKLDFRLDLFFHFLEKRCACRNLMFFQTKLEECLTQTARSKGRDGCFRNQVLVARQ